MKTILLGLVVAAALILGDTAHAADSGNLYGYVDWTSDYRFNAASESNRHGVIQGGLHWAAPDDFYLGVFVSHVDFNDFRGTGTKSTSTAASICYGMNWCGPSVIGKITYQFAVL